MKYTIISILTFFIFSAATSQVVLRLVAVNPRPTARLTDWSISKNVFTMMATNQSGQAQVLVKFKVELKDGSGAVIGSTNLATSPTFTILSSAANIFNAGDVLALQSMLFTGSAKNALTKTGRLPEGIYQLCVQAVTPVDFKPVSEIQCINFTITSYQLPILMSPANESNLDVTKAKTAIIFRWTPLVPTPAEATSYRLQVFEVMEKQTPMQAFRSNQPLLDKEIKGVTQYVWQPQLDFTCCPQGDANGDGSEKMKSDSAGKGIGPDTDPDTKTKIIKTFIWTIQTIDNNGNGFNNGVGDGRSEPAIFFIVPAGSNPKKEKSKGLKDTLKTQV